MVVENAKQSSNVADAAATVLAQVDDHALAVLVTIHQILQTSLADVVAERRIADIGHRAVADGVVHKTPRSVMIDSQIV